MEKTSAGIFKKILAKAGKNPVYVWFKSEGGYLVQKKLERYNRKISYWTKYLAEIS